MNTERIAFLLLICFQLQFYPIRELIKVPMIGIHFLSSSDDNSFIDYVIDHYSSEKIADADWQMDLKLPFKDCTQLNFAWNAIMSDYICLQTLDAAYSQIDHWFVLSLLKDGFSHEIFHPPGS